MNNINNISMEHESNYYLSPNAKDNEIREGVDRRKNTLRSLLVSPFMRRRKTIRREVDGRNSYVDIHEKSLFIIFTLTIAFSIIDAIFTLIIIKNGGEELNPFMKYIMDRDVMAFFWVKFFITSFGMLFLVVHKYFVVFRFITGYHFLYSIFSMYLLLILYEIYLLGLIFNVI